VTSIRVAFLPSTLIKDTGLLGPFQDIWINCYTHTNRPSLNLLEKLRLMDDIGVNIVLHCHNIFHRRGCFIKIDYNEFSSVRAPAQPSVLARDDFCYGYAKGQLWM
jgi:hypothetical protein